MEQIWETFAPKQVTIPHRSDFLLYKLLKAESSNFCFVGMCAIRAERDYTIEEDFMKAVRKLGDAKKLETKLDYKPV